MENTALAILSQGIPCRFVHLGEGIPCFFVHEDNAMWGIGLHLHDSQLFNGSVLVMNIGVVGYVGASGVIFKDDFCLIDLMACMRVCNLGMFGIVCSSLLGEGSNMLNESNGVGDNSSMFGSVVQSQDLGEVGGSGHTGM